MRAEYGRGWLWWVVAVGNYVKRTNMSDASASKVLHACSPGKEITGTVSPILDQVMLGKPIKKIPLPT